jgi:hypothetical protein
MRGFRFQYACEHFLDTLQDVVAEASAEPWPGTGGTMPLPMVTVSSHEIVVSFDHEGAVVVALPPIARST